MFSFSLTFRNLLIPSFFSSMTHRSLVNVLFSFQLFVYFLLLFLLLSCLVHCDQIECRGLFIFSYICWGLLYALRYDQFWRKFYGLLKKCILCRYWMKYSVDIS
jgi:hypothetical protein